MGFRSKLALCFGGTRVDNSIQDEKIATPVANNKAYALDSRPQGPQLITPEEDAWTMKYNADVERIRAEEYSNMSNGTTDLPFSLIF